MGQLKKLEKLDESRFLGRLKEYSGGDRTAISSLKASVRKVAEQAEYISGLICRYLPQYTLHDKTHSLNVLAIMEALTPDDVMKQLTPLECALCIMAAYTHDLGMALTRNEHDELLDATGRTPESQEFRTYRDGFAEELKQIERWQKKAEQEQKAEEEQEEEKYSPKRRINLIEWHILTSYIRETHTSTERIEGWLDRIADGNESLFTYGNCNFKHHLALIDASHGENANWLRTQLIQLTDRHSEDDFHDTVDNEWVNFAFPGLLLRLADIMDFDASRAPRILFKHIGIENERSILVWEKHLSISGWTINISQNSELIRYRAECRHPVYEKAIKDFKRDIDREIREVYHESDYQQRQLTHSGRDLRLRLPMEIRLRVSAKRGPDGKPIYIYKDIEFRLDQNEIQQILMGESLWGNPSLCIRELLQNALDALEMRDLRLQLQGKGEEPIEPVDVLPDNEELSVVLTWGRDEESGQEYILVKDNGVGMTEDVIKKYFTQIGKSFYRSSDFERERRAMAQKDLLATPISIFGIGILSCFMIGDRLHVRTRPGGANDADRQAYDITISGPASLFWLKEGTLEYQGTEVKVFLKEGYYLKHEPADLIDRLRENFNYERGRDRQQKEDEKKPVDPAFIAASHVVCPLYPVEIQPPDCDAIIRIDESFHSTELAPIDRAELLQKAEEWGCPESYIGDPEWGIWDWFDPDTKSRIRLWFPRNYQLENAPDRPVDPPPQNGLCRQDELAALVEPQLSGTRTVVTVKGMHVSNVKVCERKLKLANGVGCRVWVDLRGDAAPRLTADRHNALEPEDAALWRDAFHSIFKRIRAVIQNDVESLPADVEQGTVKNLLLGLQCLRFLRPQTSFKESVPNFDLIDVCDVSWGLDSTDLSVFLWSGGRFLQENALDRALVRARARDSARDRTRDRTLARALDHSHALDRALDLARALARAFDLTLDRARASDLDRTRALDRDRDFAHARAFGEAEPLYEQHLFFSVLQEAFWPDLSSSFPMLNLFHLSGKIGDAMITGPGLVEFDLGEYGRRVHSVDIQGRRPEKVVSRGYDLVFPMTAVPLGELRKQCFRWRSDRTYRPFGVLPFLIPGNEDVWSANSKFLLEFFKVDRIFALLPRVELWSKPFAQWTPEDWETCGLSALWDIESGQVLWAEGAHGVDEMSEVGKPIEEFLKDNKKINR